MFVPAVPMDNSVLQVHANSAIQTVWLAQLQQQIAWAVPLQQPYSITRVIPCPQTASPYHQMQIAHPASRDN